MHPDLQQVIEVTDPLEPETGGLYQAFLHEFDKREPMPINCPVNVNALQEGFVCLNVSSGQLLHVPVPMFTDKAFDYGLDLRVISLQEAQELDLAVHDLLALKEQATQHCSQCQASFNEFLHSGMLLSISELQDRDFVEALNEVATAFNPQVLSFDDSLYEPIFQDLERYLNYFSIKEFTTSPESQNPDLSLASGASEPSGLDMTINVYGQFDKVKEDRVADFVAHLPPLVAFLSERDYIKAQTNILAKATLNTAELLSPHGTHINLSGQSILKSPDNTPAILSKQEYEFLNSYSLPKESKLLRHNFVRDITGTMVAQRFKVPTTKNDLLRLNYYCRSDKLQDVQNDVRGYSQQAFAIATKLAHNVLSKQTETASIVPLNEKLWSTWKAEREHFASQLATPSLATLALALEHLVDKEQVAEMISHSVLHKIHALAPHQERLKEMHAAIRDFKDLAFAP